jgi:hypothetical protein
MNTGKTCATAALGLVLIALPLLPASEISGYTAASATVGAGADAGQSGDGGHEGGLQSLTIRKLDHMGKREIKNDYTLIQRHRLSFGAIHHTLARNMIILYREDRDTLVRLVRHMQTLTSTKSRKAYLDKELSRARNKQYDIMDTIRASRTAFDKRYRGSALSAASLVMFRETVLRLTNTHHLKNRYYHESDKAGSDYGDRLSAARAYEAFVTEWLRKPDTRLE